MKDGFFRRIADAMLSSVYDKPELEQELADRRAAALDDAVSTYQIHTATRHGIEVTTVITHPEEDPRRYPAGRMTTTRYTWQPIATAPRDGTTVLGYGPTAGETTAPSQHASMSVVAYSGRGDYAGYDWDVCDSGGYACWMRPTHWMPLPEPPAQEG